MKIPFLWQMSSKISSTFCCLQASRSLEKYSKVQMEYDDDDEKGEGLFFF